MLVVMTDCRQYIKVFAQILVCLMMFQWGLAAVHVEGSDETVASAEPEVSTYWVPSNSEKVMRNASFPQDNQQQTLMMETAKNGYESGQVIVKAMEADEVKKHTTATAAYPLGWYPDAIIPLHGESFKVQKGDNQGI